MIPSASCASWFFGVVAACFIAAGQEQKEPAEVPVLAFGRASLQSIEVERGSKRVRSVALVSSGKVAAHVTRINVLGMTGDPITLGLIRRDARLAVTAGEPLTYEIPAGEHSRLEITIDATDPQSALGERKATIAVENDGSGGKALELPLSWSVVEPTTAADEDRPIAKPRIDISKLSTGGPPPMLKCDRYVHDFGAVHAGEKLHTEFKLRNAGEGDLVIVKVGAQCHCTLPQLEMPSGPIDGKKLMKDEVYGTLKPGEEATLHCEVDTRGLAGQLSKTVEIYTNDPVTPHAIKLRLVVDNPFRFTPSTVSFGDVKRGEPVERVVRMASVEVGKFAITGYSLPEPQVMDVQFREVPARKDEQCAWELVLRSREDLPCKEHLGKLRLELENERISSTDQLHYSLRVSPDVLWKFKSKFAPKELNLGVMKRGANDVHSVLLESGNPLVPYVPREAHVESKLGIEPYTAEIIELEKGLRYEVKLKVVAPPKTPSFRGDLVILADHPTMPELRIGFYGMYLGGGTPAPAPKEESRGK